jgi:hypothetical protein
MYRTVRWFVLVGAGWLAVNSLPSIARFLRQRAM